MAKAVKTESGTKLWISGRQTQAWSIRPGMAWPCSEIAGKRLYAEFDKHGDLVDVSLNGKQLVNVPADEFSAITSDYLESIFGPDHPAIRR